MANRVLVTMLGCLMWTSRLFDYLDPEEGRIYNDVVRRIGSVSKNWKAQKTTVLKTRFPLSAEFTTLRLRAKGVRHSYNARTFRPDLKWLNDLTRQRILQERRRPA
jgi:hypothetical protein